MGMFNKGPKKLTFELAGREFPRVTWYKDPGLRKLYITLMFVVLTSVWIGSLYDRTAAC
jgi:hypothetical protein